MLEWVAPEDMAAVDLAWMTSSVSLEMFLVMTVSSVLSSVVEDAEEVVQEERLVLT